MSGHSKWANIKHKKARSDKRKGKIFAKLVKEIIVAARAGGADPDGNPRLRSAIDRAKSENLPGENIDRAIKKGAGELEGVNYEEIFYEGYAPGGVAVLVLAATENRNRTVSDVRHVFTKYGGKLGESGSVGWMFENKGLFTFEMGAVSEDRLFEIAIEAGAEDVIANSEDRIYEIYTTPADFIRVKKSFDREGMEYSLAELSMIPKTTIHIEGEEARQVLRLIEALEDLEDVQNVFANFDISAKEMDEVA